MHRRMITRGLNVSQNVVRLALRFINPVEVENRRQRRLKRRTYANPGPNFCWHVDGYDKLKPYGFAIHGCIDGFSRKVLWLHVSNTNNNPQVTALYFVRAVLRYKTQPMLVRCDRGSENVHIEKIQKFMRRFNDDPFAGINSFLYGRSTANQRIEAWWSMFRRQCSNFWINTFKDMQTIGLIDVDDPIHIECLRFCFLDLIRTDIDRMQTEWNTHFIQTKRHLHGIRGKPDKIFNLPGEYNTESYGNPPRVEELQEVEMELEKDEGDPDVINLDVVRLANILIPGWEAPENVQDAQTLYCSLINNIALHDE